jgi:hypothetical protein
MARKVTVGGGAQAELAHDWNTVGRFETGLKGRRDCWPIAVQPIDGESAGSHAHGQASVETTLLRAAVVIASAPVMAPASADSVGGGPPRTPTMPTFR